MTDIPADRILRADDLEELMRSVNDVTRQLQDTHVQLRSEVARLQRELEEANAQLRRSRSLAALGEMAAGIAHEVRNPLGSIQLYSQLLADDLADRPEQARICTKISRAVEGLDAVVRDVMLFAREVKLNPATISAADLVQRALDNCASLIASPPEPTGDGADSVAHVSDGSRPSRPAVSINRDINAESAIELEADGPLVAGAIANVVRNAIEAMAETPREQRVLRLTVTRAMRRNPGGERTRRSPHIVFTIEDNGPGIPEDVVKRMFNPFFTTRQSGTGLGLAIVHQIVDAHGGHVSVASATPDESQSTVQPLHGARFELCLPPQPSTPADDADGQSDERGGIDLSVSRRICTEATA